MLEKQHETLIKQFMGRAVRPVVGRARIEPCRQHPLGTRLWPIRFAVAIA
jgi:hypothetical protein